MTPEGRVKAKVKKVLGSYPEDCFAFMPVQTGYGRQGLDWFLCFCGRFVAIETKADASKKLTPNQIQTKAAIERAGGIVMVVYDDDTLELLRAKLNWMYLATAPRRLKRS